MERTKNVSPPDYTPESSVPQKLLSYLLTITIHMKIYQYRYHRFILHLDNEINIIL